MAESVYRERVGQWLNTDAQRQALLQTAARLALPDWCLAAGFVRNLVWDKLHGYRRNTPLNDVDLVYFDASNVCANRDRACEEYLHKKLPARWSVKNQARMHRRNGDSPYLSNEDALSHWVELETAVGVRRCAAGLQFVAPFGLAPLFAKTITLNPKCRNSQIFMARVEQKKWRELWPQLRLAGLPDSGGLA